MKIILVPIDFTDVSNSTVEAAFSLVQDIHVKLVFLYVETPATPFDRPGQPAESSTKTRAHAEERLRLIARQAQDQRIIASFRATSERPVEQILHYAETLKASLIVMGTHHYDVVAGS